ncbi:MAG: phosphoenolpyruvate carboxykinase (ATP) [Bacteriovoracaceae bacterium]
MTQSIDLSGLGITRPQIYRNLTPAVYYQHALKDDPDAIITSSGALATRSGERTGRSPKDKRVIRHPESEENICWGDINIELDEKSFLINRERAIDYFNTREKIYILDGYAGWDPKYQLKIRIICTRPYHALFMHNMLIRPTEEQLASFGEPDYMILNSGEFPANTYTRGMTSKTSVDLSFEHKQMVILGTEYAGEMKKGVFTIMNYLMPLNDVLSMHCSVNEGDNGDVSVFFGLSGTGKTTLSAEPHRKLIGDDEHCWTDHGLFNIEGGCYAKCDGLSAEKEPEIYNAIKFGALLENVVYDEASHVVDYEDTSLTQNTRCSYPIEYIPNAKIPCVTGHANNIIFLTCDAFGVLPPVSKLSVEAAMYHFISGYTAKVAGTEQGVTEPEATFSACFGAAFMVWHPIKYAELLASRMKEHNCHAWLVNTGWTGGPYGVGNRIGLKETRHIIDGIHSGELAKTQFKLHETFGLEYPVEISGVDSKLLDPRQGWTDKEAYDQTAQKLANLFVGNFEQFKDQVPSSVIEAGPRA